MDIKLHVVEDETTTIVHTVLDLRGDHFESTGKARRNPVDPPVPLVGEELAVARAPARPVGSAHRGGSGENRDLQALM